MDYKKLLILRGLYHEKNLLTFIFITLTLTSCGGVLNTNSNENQSTQSTVEESQDEIVEVGLSGAEINVVNFMLDGVYWEPYGADYEALPSIYYLENVYIPISSVEAIRNREIIGNVENKTISFQYQDITPKEIAQATEYLDNFFSCISNGDYYTAKNYCTGAFSEIDIKNDDVFSSAILIDSKVVQEYVDTNKELFFESTLKIKPTDYTKQLYGDTDTIRMYLRFDRSLLDGSFKLSGSGSGL